MTRERKWICGGKPRSVEKMNRGKEMGLLREKQRKGQNACRVREGGLLLCIERHEGRGAH